MSLPHERFVQRHIGTSEDHGAMLAVVGATSANELVRNAIPRNIASAGNHPDGGTEKTPSIAAATEAEVTEELRTKASRNTVAVSMIGLGYYGTHTPAVIQRNVLENPSWYTAYTPYQPEISQGRLEALINFQTMVTDLTGLATANASMLDESTAVVEGMLLARRASKSASNVFIVDADALPQTKALLANRAEPLGIELVESDVASWQGADGQPVPEAFGVFVQYPGASGRVWDPTSVIDRVHEHKGLAVVAADLLALVLLKSPGLLGADIAVGTTQRFGVPMGFGGPNAGYLAVRSGLERQMPGRLVGVSVDADGSPAYRLTLQTREQHIRREKATSNICTAQVLLAIMAGMYAVYHGPDGLRAIAQGVASKAAALADLLTQTGHTLVHSQVFDTLLVRAEGRAAAVVARAAEAGLNLWLVDADTVSVSVDETTTPEQVMRAAKAFQRAAPDANFASPSEAPYDDSEVFASGDENLLPGDLLREDPILTHAVFNSYHSETAMMRYLKRLADYDYALDRGMIPLGSCTMKLNAATEMTAITWPGFAHIHPFAPANQVAGYLELIGELSEWLCQITGYDAISLQPNAGSQGELAGLLAIRGYHRANGDLDRNVCLIPSSAHGTNAASAVLAGMKVVVVSCDQAGNVDLGDLREKIVQTGSSLSALMITYPSTHGVYEQGVREICELVHAAGGQVYIDGANLNALVEFAKFGEFGGDVSHLNLHKTFAIPHGGGGPGVGPVAAKAHLAPYLPGHPYAQAGSHAAPVSAAPFGSASILPISWAFIRLMGSAGLQQATGAAVLAANYVATRLADDYPILYTENGRVAHECILDLRPLKEATGITVDDVAKRLIDYGFHAPTMSFPVAGTLMVEPTESEDLVELDRFVAAMKQIKVEAEAVAAGQWPSDDNPLVNAPHTARSLVSDWSHPYTREQAVYPFLAVTPDPAQAAARVAGKYWPPVRRIDQAYGDRNLVCSCPPPEAFV